MNATGANYAVWINNEIRYISIYPNLERYLSHFVYDLNDVNSPYGVIEFLNGRATCHWTRNRDLLPKEFLTALLLDGVLK